MHVFEFVQTKTTGDDDDGIELVRRGSSRADVALSDFGRFYTSDDQMKQALNPATVAAHLIPCFELAASLVPKKYHSTTLVKYQATAGMRLLPLDEQDAIYNALYQGLIEDSRFVFSGMQRKDIETLSGELEGLYGAIAANYLRGIVRADLRLIAATNNRTDNNSNNDDGDDDDGSWSSIVGALDMGGASTQLVFLPARQTEQEHEHQNDDVRERRDSNGEARMFPDKSGVLQGDSFFSSSYLSYGVDRFRERFWDTLVEDWRQETFIRYDKDDQFASLSREVDNPCANKGYKTQWQGITLVGTGDTAACVRHTQRLIPHPHHSSNHTTSSHSHTVGGRTHPPIRGSFLAMSLYFFSLDSLRVLSIGDAKETLNKVWPTPTLHELSNTLNGLCSRPYQELLKLEHSFTSQEVLPHRCFETVYMVTLLKDGFGFDPNERSITYTFLVNGTEVEWTLGMALTLYNNNQKMSDDIDATVQHNSHVQNNFMVLDREDKSFSQESSASGHVIRMCGNEDQQIVGTEDFYSNTSSASFPSLRASECTAS